MFGRLAMGFANVRAGTRVLKRSILLQFDRGSASSNSVEAIEALATKLEVARRQGAIVVTTPGAVKSLMLKQIDLLQSVQVLSPRTLSPFYIENTSVHSKGVGEWPFSYADDFRGGSRLLTINVQIKPPEHQRIP